VLDWESDKDDSQDSDSILSEVSSVVDNTGRAIQAVAQAIAFEQNAHMAAAAANNNNID